MVGFRIPSLGVPRCFQRTLGVVTAALAFLAFTPQAWGSGPTFTVANTTFPSTAVGKSTSQNVTLTVNTAVPITSIAIAPNFTEYTIGTITGCTVNSAGTTIVAAGTVCTIPVTFTPKFPGIATAPPPISRSAPLLVTDIEGGNPNGYSFALSGSATGQVFAFAPGYLTAFVGNASFVGGFTPGCPGQTDANGDGCPATDALFDPPSMALDPAGNLFMSEGLLNIVNRVDAVTGIVNVYAGQYKKQGTGGSGGPATSIELFNPDAISVDQAGNVYVDDPAQGLWEINPASGIATIIAGGGSYSIAQAIADGKTAAEANFGDVFAMLVDASGNIYFTVYSTGTVYRVDAVTDLISVVVGNGTPTVPATGIPGVAVNAKLGQPAALAMDSKGNLYIADAQNQLVLRVDTSGNISVVAGTQSTSFGNDLCANDSGDWGPATSAVVGQPSALAFDTADNLYIGEPGGQSGPSCPIRRVDAATGLIHTIAGDNTQTYGFLNNVGATDTYLSPNLVSVDGGGNIYVGQQNISSGVSKIIPSQSSIIFPQQSDFVTGLQVVTASNVGIGTDLTLSNYPFPIVPVPITATPTPFSNQLLTGANPQDCSVGTLPPAGVCGIQIAFDPTKLAKVSATETVEDNSLGVPGTTNVISITGSGYNNATATLTPNPITFMSQPVGTPTAPSLVNFSIFLNPALTYESTTISGPDASSFTLSTPASAPCTTGLAIVAGGGDCNIGVIFNPQSGGALSATLNVTWEALGFTYILSAPISGTGTAAAAPIASLSPSPLAFGGQVYNTTSPAQAATLSNTGNAALTGIVPTLTGTNPNDFAILTTGTNACGSSLAAGSSCNIWVTFTPASTGNLQATLSVADNATPSPQTISLTGTGIQFVSNVGTAQAAQAVTVYITTAGTASAINVMTQGASNLDFTMASGGTCATGTAYTVGDTCTVEVGFKPLYAGTRNGAIMLTDAGGNVLGTTYLPGEGTGPQIVFAPAVQTNLLPATTYAPVGVAADASGNVYAVDSTHNAVVKVPWTGSGYGTPVSLGSGYNEPIGVAVDGAGNVFVGDYAGENLIEVPWNGSAYGTQINVPLGATLRQPRHLTIDGNGNIYFADYAQDQVVKVPWTGAAYGTPVVVPFTGVNSVNGVAVDSNGDVFCANTYSHNVLMLPWTGTGYGTQVTVVGGLTGLPIAVAVDPAGNVYVAVQSQEVVLKVPPAGAGTYGTPVTIPVTGLTGIWDVGLDGAANVYVADYLSQQVYKVDVADAPSLTFASTNVGSTSTDSPKTVTVSNIGNASMAFTAGTNPSYPADFPVNSADTNLCGPANPLAVDGSCDVSVNFEPTTGGPLSGFVVLTDDDLNVASAKQSIVVSGTAIAATAPVASFSPNPIAFTDQIVGTTSAPFAVMLSNTGNAPLNNISPTLGGTVPGDFAVSTNGTNGCTSSLSAGSSCFFYVTFTPNMAAGFSATLMVADNASGSPQMIPITGTGIQFVSNVGTAQTAQAVTVYITTAGTPSSIQVLTQGAANLDFTMTTGGTCATGTAYTIGETCTVNVGFKPLYAGTRNGAILLTDGSGNVLGVTYLPGTGNGPQIVFGPGVETSVPGTQVTPWGVAVDGAGNVYLNNTNFGSVLQIPWTGSAYGTAVTIATNVASAFGKSIAVDGAGNVFVGSNEPGAIVTEIPRTPTGWGTQLIVPTTGVSGAFGITVDALGSLYIADSSGQVVKLPWTGNGYGTQITLPATGLISPYGVAVDAAGNVYIADHDTNLVVELPWTGSGYGTQTTVPSAGLTSLTGLAVDGTSNLYVAGGTGSTAEIVRIPWSGSAYGTPTVLPGFDYTQVAVDGAGNVYGNEGLYANSELGIFKIDLADPPSLTFASTNVGSTSTDSPQTVPITNIGNVDLYFNAATNNPVYPVNFPINNNDTNLCEEDNSVSEGNSCDVSANFTPTTGGSLSGDVVLTDNDLNAANAMQSIPVSGAGLQMSAVATPQISPGTGTYFTNQSVTITDSTANAIICYTTDGSTPTAANGACTHGSAYSAAISVSQTGTTVQAIGTLSGDTNSAVASATYTLQAVAPTLSPPGGTYIGAQSVTLSTTTTGGQIYYTTNGTQPSGGSPSILYNGTAIAVTTSGTVINAITVNTGYVNSAVSTGTYTLQLPVAALSSVPAFPNTLSGATSTAQSATLSNSGNAPLTNIVPTITGTNPTDFAFTTGSNACGSTLAVDSSCFIYVTFTPSSAASFTATLSVADNASGSPQTTSLTGTGTVPPDFTISASPGSDTVLPGAQATYTVTVGGTGGFNNNVNLSVSGLPPGATGSFSPQQVNPGDGPATSTLTVQAAAGQLSQSRTSLWPLATPALAMLFLLPFRRWRKVWKGKVLLLLMAGLVSLAAATSLMGCGGGFGFNKQPQTYTLTITGASGTDTHSTTVQLTVQ